MLELERLVEKRYFTGVPTTPEERDFIVKAWTDASRLVLEAVGVLEFDIGVYNTVFTAYGGVWEGVFNDALNICIESFSAKR